MSKRLASQQRFDPEHLLLLVRINTKGVYCLRRRRIVTNVANLIEGCLYKKRLNVLRTKPFFSSFDNYSSVS